MNQVLPITHDEFVHDEDLLVVCDPLAEEEGCVATFDQSNLHNVTFSEAVLKTHRAMSEAIEERLKDESGQLRFYSDYTGRGKTTGAILTIGEKISDSDHAMKRALFLTRECAGVEEVYQLFAATWPNLSIAPWSGAHKVGGEIKMDVARNDVTEEEAREAQIVVSTHSAAKKWMKYRKYPLGADFDFVLVDEYPEPVIGDTLKPSEILAWHERDQYGPRGDTLLKVKKWVHDLQDQTDKQLERPDWLDQINDGFDKRLVGLAEAIGAGRAFITQQGAYQHLQWSRLLVPFEGRALVCSATNELEGWQLDPKLKPETLVAHRGKPTDYSQAQVRFMPWPEYAKTQNPELGDRQTARLLRDQVVSELENLPKDGGDVFVLMPKALREGLSKGFFDSVANRHTGKIMVQHWGAGIGSNAFQGCSHAIIVGLHHLNALGVVQKIKAHRGYQSDTLRRGGANTKVVYDTKDDEHARQVIQMLSRICIRQMDEAADNTYLAKAANIVWIATPKDTDKIAAVLKKSFKNIRIDRVEVPEEFLVVDDVTQLRCWIERAKWVGKQMDNLAIQEFTYADVDARFGIQPKESRQKKKFNAGLQAVGWQVTIGDGRGNHTRFSRLGS